MTEERTTGVIVRTRLLTETSLIVQWLTADAGRISTVAKGARRAKSPYRGKLDLFHVADLTFRRSRRSDLHTLSEVGMKGTYPALRTDWRRLNQAAYGVALIEQTTEADTPLFEIYEGFLGYLGHINARAPAVWSVLALEWKHLTEMGMAPNLDREGLSPGVRRLVEEIMERDWAAMTGWEPTAGALSSMPSLARFLESFLVFHLGRLPRGRAEALGPGV